MIDDHRYIDAYDYVQNGVNGHLYKALDRWTIQGRMVHSMFTVTNRAEGAGDATGWTAVSEYHRDLCTPIQRWLEQERDHENV